MAAVRNNDGRQPEATEHVESESCSSGEQLGYFLPCLDTGGKAVELETVLAGGGALALSPQQCTRGSGKSLKRDRSNPLCRSQFCVMKYHHFCRRKQ
jgi:hypothetical protein